jgi:hypothetical protein
MENKDTKDSPGEIAVMNTNKIVHDSVQNFTWEELGLRLLNFVENSMKEGRKRSLNKRIINTINYNDMDRKELQKRAKIKGLVASSPSTDLIYYMRRLNKGQKICSRHYILSRRSSTESYENCCSS